MLEPIKIGDCDYCQEGDIPVIDMSLHHKKQEWWCLRCLREKENELIKYIMRIHE